MARYYRRCIYLDAATADFAEQLPGTRGQSFSKWIREQAAAVREGR